LFSPFPCVHRHFEFCGPFAASLSSARDAPCLALRCGDFPCFCGCRALVPTLLSLSSVKPFFGALSGLFHVILVAFFHSSRRNSLLDFSLFGALNGQRFSLCRRLLSRTIGVFLLFVLIFFSSETFVRLALFAPGSPFLGLRT